MRASRQGRDGFAGRLDGALELEARRLKLRDSPMHHWSKSV